MYLQVCLQVVILSRNILLCNQGRRLKSLQASGYTFYSVNFVTLWLLYVGRPGETSETRLQQLWTKASMMLDWASLLICIVLMLAVFTDVRWKLAAAYCNTMRCHHVAWCCRQTQDVLHPGECPSATLQTSQWQWTASVCTT
jgi:hypothetical protein